jgi:uncharacterized membrane protein
MINMESPAMPAPVLREANSSGQSRVQTVDAVRGAVIIIMALDHVRDFISSAAMSFSPTDLTRTTTAIFFTRWITHFCAPVFAFTAGIGAFLWLGRNGTKAQLSRFLLTRGLWLIVLELTVLRFILFLNVGFSNTLIILSVIWMLGLCMVVLAGLIHLPTRLLATLSIAMIAGHNLFDHVAAERFGSAAWVWDIVHQQGVFRFHDATVLVAYPLVPWMAVMAAGYCFGAVLLWEPARRQRLLVRLGFIMSLVFILLRAWNIYGDPARWSVQSSRLFTILSFLNCTKYPPSLLFLLMTLGPAMVAMAWLERRQLSAANPVMVFGRVPFFFFVVHLAVIHSLAIILGLLRYGRTSFLLIPPPSMSSMRQEFPAGYGYGLWVVYAVWIGVITMLYLVCRWFAQLKQRRRDWWLSYL